ncbi:cytochrome c oxidase assembly factor CtaG [Oceanobacillus sp. CAU 1775]
MWLELQIFGFRALWSPYFLAFCIILALIYYLMTGPYRHKFGGGNEEPPTVKQHLFIYIGLFLLYVVKGSPVDLLSHIMLTAHMTQMAIFLLLFPILIIKGIPLWIWEKIVYAPIIKPIVLLLTKPLISLLLFNGLFSVYHIPAVFDFSKSAPLWHFIIHAILLLAAFNVFLPLLLPFKEINTMSPMMKIGYIFANGVLITPACALIIFASEPLYSAYSEEGAWLQALALCVPGDILSGITIPLSGPEVFSPLSTVIDQQFGGIIMKVLQEIIYIVLLTTTFFKWFNSKGREIDPISDPFPADTKA